MLTFLLCVMLKAPKSLNRDEVGELTGSAKRKACSERRFKANKQCYGPMANSRLRLTMSAVAEILGTVIKETRGAAAAGHPLKTQTHTINKHQSGIWVRVHTDKHVNFTSIMRNFVQITKPTWTWINIIHAMTFTSWWFLKPLYSCYMFICTKFLVNECYSDNLTLNATLNLKTYCAGSSVGRNVMN